VNDIPIIKTMDMIFKDEPIKALEYVKTQEGPEFRNIERKLKERLDHIINPEVYVDKYRDAKITWYPEGLWNKRFQWIMTEVQSLKPKNYIDFGCYEGSLVLKIAELFEIPTIGVEISKEMVKWNNSRVPEDVNAKFIQSSIEDFDTDEKFDVAVCMEVIEHVAEPKKLVNKMLSVLKDGGTGFITTPDGCYDVACTIRIWETPGIHFDHVRTYTAESLKEEIGVEDVQVFKGDGELYAKFRK
jgi:2-polyprenyl-3-methyl-5-hydroxy-6-metoxy-1,4-benzoquinol methylase